MYMYNSLSSLPFTSPFAGLARDPTEEYLPCSLVSLQIGLVRPMLTGSSRVPSRAHFNYSYCSNKASTPFPSTDEKSGRILRRLGPLAGLGPVVLLLKQVALDLAVLEEFEVFVWICSIASLVCVFNQVRPCYGFQDSRSSLPSRPIPAGKKKPAGR